MTQLELFTASRIRFRHELIDYLNEGSGQPVDVTLTKNRVTMLSVAFTAEGPIKIRLHEKYLNAPEEVIHSLRTYLRTRHRKAWDEAAAYGIQPDASSPRPLPNLKPARGQTYDLETLMRDVNREFFNGKVRCLITWGRRGRSSNRKGRSCILYGSYDRESKLIRIHPALDNPQVPEDFVKYVIFHEMLHAVVPVVKRNGRTEHHGPIFKKLEQSYPDFQKMQNLAAKLLHTLT